MLADGSGGTGNEGTALNTGEEGQAFRHARERHGLSLDAIADELLVRAGLLEAIESGTIDEVANPAVAQAHRRVYARFLGFDAEAVLGGEPPGEPGPASAAAEPAAQLRGAPPRLAPEPFSAAEDAGADVVSDADADADSQADADDEAELVAVWSAAQPLGSDMTLTALRCLARYAHPGRVTKLGKARLTAFLQRSSRQQWGEERAAAIIAAADATVRLWGPDGMDFDALAADIAVEARLALALSEEIKTLDTRIAEFYEQVDPDGIVRSTPGVGKVGAPQIKGRLGDATRFANLASVRSFAGLIPHQDSSGQASRAGGPTKAGDACLREALFMAADHARKIDPTLAARYHRLIVEGGKHHNSAVCTLSAVLLTRIAACLRNGTRYDLRDTDGRAITETEGRAIVAQRYTIPAKVRAARRKVTVQTRQPRRNERAKTGVASRSEAPPVPRPA
ncbi:MAG: transposase [Egibacteraceae bacterium]